MKNKTGWLIFIVVAAALARHPPASALAAFCSRRRCITGESPVNLPCISHVGRTTCCRYDSCEQISVFCALCPPFSGGDLHTAALAIGFVEEHRCGTADVQRVHRRRHGNRSGLVAGRKHGGRDAVAFAPEYDAAVAREIGLREGSVFGVRVRGNTTDAAVAEVVEGLDQAGGLDDGHLEDAAHRASHRAAQEWAAAGFADDERLGAEGRAIADQGPEILGAGEAIGGGQEPWR